MKAEKIDSSSKPENDTVTILAQVRVNLVGIKYAHDHIPGKGKQILTLCKRLLYYLYRLYPT